MVFDSEQAYVVHKAAVHTSMGEASGGGIAGTDTGDVAGLGANVLPEESQDSLSES
jgi:hypothetical protein